jgi:hypothetical protein
MGIFSVFCGNTEKSLRSGIQYIKEFDIDKVVQHFIENNTSLKYAFIEDYNTKQYIIKISKDIIDKLNSIKENVKGQNNKL